MSIGFFLKIICPISESFSITSKVFWRLKDSKSSYCFEICFISKEGILFIESFCKVSYRKKAYESFFIYIVSLKDSYNFANNSKSFLFHWRTIKAIFSTMFFKWLSKSFYLWYFWKALLSTCKLFNLQKPLGIFSVFWKFFKWSLYLDIFQRSFQSFIFIEELSRSSI